MNIITGYCGEPHITSEQDRGCNQGAFGTGSYVLNVGNKLAATIASNNEIQIADGVLSHQGCTAIIEAGTYDSVSISNGAQGMNRIDRIVARYTKDPDTNIESVSLVVITGTSTSDAPSAPSYTTGNIQTGSLTVDMPLYNVRLTGVAITSCTAQFTVLRTQAETDTLLGNTDISSIGNGTVTGAIYTLLSNISQFSLNITRADSTGSGFAGFTSYCDTVTAGKMQFFRMRNGTPTSSWNYSVGLILRSTESETVVVMFGYNVDGIAILRKKSGTWDAAWKSITLS